MGLRRPRFLNGGRAGRLWAYTCIHREGIRYRVSTVEGRVGDGLRDAGGPGAPSGCGVDLRCIDCKRVALKAAAARLTGLSQLDVLIPLVRVSVDLAQGGPFSTTPRKLPPRPPPRSLLLILMLVTFVVLLMTV